MAEALRCAHCAASMPAAPPELALVPCPSCGELNRVGAELVSELHAHTRAVDRIQREAEGAGEFAALAETTRSFGNGWAWFIVGGWLLGGLLMVPGGAAWTVLGVTVAALPLVAMMLVARRRMKRAGRHNEAERTRERPVILCCPGCGGHNEVLPNDVVAPCRYCRGALAAGPEERAAMLAAAVESRDSEARKATIEGWRLDAHRNRDPRTELVPFFVIGGIGSLLVFGTVALDARQLFAFSPESPHGLELLALNLVSALIVGAVTIPLMVMRRRSRRWFAGLGAFAQRTGAHLHRDLGVFADYLGAHWWGSFSSRRICAGRDYGLLVAGGPPWWAITVAPRAQEDGIVTRHLRVLIPGEASGDLLRGYAARLTELGLRCEESEGGLVASVEGEEVEAFVAEGKLDGLASALEGAEAR